MDSRHRSNTRKKSLKAKEGICNVLGNRRKIGTRWIWGKLQAPSKSRRTVTASGQTSFLSKKECMGRPLCVHHPSTSPLFCHQVRQYLGRSTLPESLEFITKEQWRTRLWPFLPRVDACFRNPRWSGQALSGLFGSSQSMSQSGGSLRIWVLLSLRNNYLF